MRLFTIAPGFPTLGEDNACFTARDGAEARLKHALGYEALGDQRNSP
jgi:hypothetical protein